MRTPHFLPKIEQSGFQVENYLTELFNGHFLLLLLLKASDPEKIFRRIFISQSRVAQALGLTGHSEPVIFRTDKSTKWR
jgi:hypothetical protein